jgi:hypothetical protein
VEFDVVPAHENFRGLSYGDWAAIWNNWLMSEDPDNTTRKDILFLRGNLGYKPVGTSNHTPRFSDPRSALTRIEENAERIFEKTAILIPVLTATYSIGDIYEGRRLHTECELRDAVNRDTDESLRIWARIALGKKVLRIVDDLNEYRIESPLFKLSIPTNSRLRLRTQIVADAGIYDAVVGGFFLILRSLLPGKYRIEFGGKGRGNYGTNSIYDIVVGGVRDNTIIDSTIEMIRDRY